MCLLVDGFLTAVWRERIREAGGVLCVYKEFARPFDDLRSANGAFRWTPGWSEAEGRLPGRIADGTEVHGGGFHVYLPVPTARLWGLVNVFVPFRARAEDFVAAGNGKEAVFRKLHLDPADYEHALERGKEKLDPSVLAGLIEASKRGAQASIFNATERWQVGRPNRRWWAHFARHGEDQTRNTWVRRALVDMTPGDGEEPVVCLQFEGARRQGRRRIVRRSIGEHERSWTRHDPDTAA